MNRPFLAGDEPQPGLLSLSRLARSLADALDSAASHNGPRTHNLASMVRAYLRARRRRDSLFASDMFADPVWDILLDLFACNLEGRRVCISDACIAASVPPTTALRWLGRMEECQLVVRRQDEADGRRVYVELSATANAAMSQWLERFVSELDQSANDIVPAFSGGSAFRM